MAKILEICFWTLSFQTKTNQKNVFTESNKPWRWDIFVQQRRTRLEFTHSKTLTRLLLVRIRASYRLLSMNNRLSHNTSRCRMCTLWETCQHSEKNFSQTKRANTLRLSLYLNLPLLRCWCCWIWTLSKPSRCRLACPLSCNLWALERQFLSNRKKVLKDKWIWKWTELF